MADGPLAGRTALISGASRNIGRQIAIDLAAQGAAVVVNAVQDAQAAESVADEIRALGGVAISHLAEITDRAGVDAMVARASAELGAPTILICNASARGQVPFLEMTHEQFRRVVDISLDGAFHLAQACLPAMLEAGWGRIVTLGGISWHVGTPGRAHNLTGKAGLAGFTRALAAEYAQTGVTVNMISPGHIDTVRPASAGNSPAVPAAIPMGRKGTVHEISSAVRFLCQPDQSYITGQTLHVNGGHFLGG
ncbi:MAG: SDR family NAD(P)-dependent oxidoreductase [Pseudomonadota bacterium]